MTSSSFVRSLDFCTYYILFIRTLHPLFSLKYRMDPTLPRIYKFLFLYLRIVIIFGLCFYFLRDYDNIENILKYAKTSIRNKHLIFIGVSIIVCACILIPVPTFVFRICRSHYYLVQRDKLTDIGGNSSENSNPDNKQKENTKLHVVPIDPTLPMKLLFIVNATSHEKLEGASHDKELEFA